MLKESRTRGVTIWEMDTHPGNITLHSKQPLWMYYTEMKGKWVTQQCASVQRRIFKTVLKMYLFYRISLNMTIVNQSGFVVYLLFILFPGLQKL